MEVPLPESPDPPRVIDSSREPPEYVLVVCPVCRARLHPRVTAEARQVKCPDCFIPVNVPPLGEVLQRLEEEERYRPRPQEIEPYRLAAPNAPRKDPEEDAGHYVAVHCGVCKARLTPLVEDQPRTIACPDCQEPCHVPGRGELPPKPRKKRRKIGTYQASAAEPQPRPFLTGVMDAQAEIREEPLPDPPRWTFFTGTFSFPWRGDAAGRWACLAAGFTLIGLLVALLDWVGAGLVVMGFFALPIIWMLVLTLSYAAAWSLAVLEDTAAGNDRVWDWPDVNWREAAGRLVYVSFLAIVTQVMAYGLGRGVESLTGAGGWWISLLALVVLYPVVLLSSLEANSPWVPLTLPILRTLPGLWWGWLLFYALTTLMGVGWLGLVVFGASDFPFVTALTAGPLTAAAILIYARLLGRLAWRAANAEELQQKKKGPFQGMPGGPAEETVEPPPMEHGRLTDASLFP